MKNSQNLGKNMMDASILNKATCDITVSNHNARVWEVIEKTRVGMLNHTIQRRFACKVTGSAP